MNYHSITSEFDVDDYVDFESRRRQRDWRRVEIVALTSGILVVMGCMILFRYQFADGPWNMTICHSIEMKAIPNYPTYYLQTLEYHTIISPSETHFKHQICGNTRPCINPGTSIDCYYSEMNPFLCRLQFMYEGFEQIALPFVLAALAFSISASCLLIRWLIKICRCG